MSRFEVDEMMQLFDPAITFNVPNTSCISGSLALQVLPTIASLVGEACVDGIQFDLLDLTAGEDGVSARVDGFAADSGLRRH